ncbi:hypothetical protein J2TS4_48700 [Paenibacillus sp. J2TS4]|nr:hypothetical protein J2TS4_48700 [Paenibacillus sp. J2TS4]
MNKVVALGHWHILRGIPAALFQTPTYLYRNHSSMGVRGGVRSWSDWISYSENPIATGEE